MLSQARSFIFCHQDYTISWMCDRSQSCVLAPYHDVLAACITCLFISNRASSHIHSHEVALVSIKSTSSGCNHEVVLAMSMCDFVHVTMLCLDTSQASQEQWRNIKRVLDQVDLDSDKGLSYSVDPVPLSWLTPRDPVPPAGALVAVEAPPAPEHSDWAKLPSFGGLLSDSEDEPKSTPSRPSFVPTMSPCSCNSPDPGVKFGELSEDFMEDCFTTPPLTASWNGIVLGARSERSKKGKSKRGSVKASDKVKGTMPGKKDRCCCSSCGVCVLLRIKMHINRNIMDQDVVHQFRYTSRCNSHCSNRVRV